MTLTKFVGGTLAKSAEVNENFNEGLTLQGLNHIRTLLNRAGVYSKGTTDWWGESYGQLRGTNSSISITGTTAGTLLNDKITACKNLNNETTHTAGTVANAANAFDSGTSYATITGNNISALGKTFTSQYVAYLSAHVYSGGNCSYAVQTYDGATWSSVATGSNSGGTTNYLTFTIDAIAEGARILVTDGSDYMRVYSMSIIGNTEETLIVQTIPAGTFSATSSNVIGVPLIGDWEDGADVTFMLTNATTSTAYLTSGTTCAIQNFTAFLSEPTTVTIKLTTATTPTVGYPSLKGFALRCT